MDLLSVRLHRKRPHVDVIGPPPFVGGSSSSTAIVSGSPSSSTVPPPAIDPFYRRPQKYHTSYDALGRRHRTKEPSGRVQLKSESLAKARAALAEKRLASEKRVGVEAGRVLSGVAADTRLRHKLRLSRKSAEARVQRLRQFIIRLLKGGLQ